MSKTSRRAFLSGQATSELLAAAAAGPPEALPLPAAAVGVEPGSHLLSVSREAMACLFEVVFDAALFRHATEVAVAALDLVDLLEGQLTVYRATSDVMRINQLAVAAPLCVERDLFELLQRAQCLAQQTGGAFDFAAGALSKTWGFYRRQGAMPSPPDIDLALAASGWQHVELVDEHATVRLLRPGVELNLGAIGKGYALDRAAACLVAGGLTQFLMHGGNSSVLAQGREQGWTVALRHPLRPSVRLAEFVLHNQALGTSGSGTQFFHYQGQRYGHIIDPRTGWPADRLLSATVIAPTAEQADALSTAFYVLGAEAASEYCAQHPEISALLCPADDSAELPLIPLNLADDAWRRL